MKNFFLISRVNLLFLFISLVYLIFILGTDYISFYNTEWLHTGNDTPSTYMGWVFFKNDIWRFPLGGNPNYGGELGNSIVFTDSIPLLALFFKLFKYFIPDNFQYFSLWYFICFYFQLYFSFKILKKFTNSTLYSFIGSIFFLIAPILLYRLSWAHALSGQWILLFALYVGLTKKISKSNAVWIFIIILSSLINYNFTLVTLIAYSILRLSDFTLSTDGFFKISKDFIILSTLLLSTFYVVGYFEIRMVDALGVGFGNYKLNLLSMFDPIHTERGIYWSHFLPDIKLSKGEEMEGFNYLGLGQILMVLFAFIVFFKNKNKINLFSIENSKRIKLFIIISLIITVWSLSNKIAFGSYVLVDIPLNNYVFALMSVAKSTGRLFWIVNYFLVILSIIIIHKCFKEKYSMFIIAFFLIIQVADTSTGIKQSLNLITHVGKDFRLKDKLWDDLFKKYKIIKTTFPISYSGLLPRLSYLMEKHKTEKTNIVMMGRGDRKATAEARYKLYSDFRQKNLSTDTVYIIDNNLGHLRHLKYLFTNENVGFFFRDNIWSLVKDEKNQMNNKDRQMLEDLKLKTLIIDDEQDLYFKEKDNYYGFGWSHNFLNLGIWSEGSLSTLFFKTEKKYGNLKLEILCDPYTTKKNEYLEFDVYINDKFNKNIKLTDNSKIEILINAQDIENKEVKVDFSFKNPISPYEVLESPDSRKLGILLKKIKISLI